MTADSTHVLLIEDNPGDARLIRELLREASSPPFELDHADRLSTGLARLSAGEAAAVLLDLSLPDSQGLDTLARVRAHAPRAPIVVLTGREDEALGLQLVQSGAQDYLVKGQVDSNLLVRSIRYAIERKQAEEELRAGDMRLRMIAENMPGMVAQTDLTGVYQYVSPSHQNALGYEPQALLGKSIFDLMHPEDTERVRTTVQHALRTDRLAGTMEFRYRHADGHYLWLVSTGNLLRDAQGAGMGAVFSTRDITERKRAEGALRENESRLKSLFETMAEGVILIAPDGWIVQANRAAEHILGLARSEITERHYVAPEWRIVRPDGTPMPPEEMAGPRAMKELQTVKDVVMGVERPGGALAWINVSASPLFNEHGELEGVVGTFADITERIQAEDRVRQSAARAEALVRIAARLNAQLDLDAVLKAVCEETARALDVSATSVTLYDPARDALLLATTIGLPPTYRAEHKPIPRATYDRYARQSGAVITIPDVQAAGLPDADLYARLNIRTIATASILRGEELRGGINLYALGEVRRFSDDELALLKGIADQAAQAITNARLYEETLLRIEQLGTLYDAGLALNRVLDSRVQLEFLSTLASQALRAERAEFYRYDPTDHALQFEFGAGRGEAEQAAGREARQPVAEEHSPAGWVAHNRVHLYAPDLSADSRWAPAYPGIRSGLWAPVQREQELRGVLGVLSPRANAFTPHDERLLVLFANQTAVAMENAQLLETSQRRLDQSQALHAIDLAITGSLDLGVTLAVVLEQVTTQLRVDAADVLLLDEHTQSLDYAAGRGFRTQALRHTRLRLGDGYAGRAALERRIVNVPNLIDTPNGLTSSPLLTSEGFSAYFAIPLIAKGQVKGVLEVFHRAPLASDPEWLDYLQAVATQTAIAVDSAQLFERLQRSNTDLQMAYDATIEGWSRALDLRDKETEGHTGRVTELALRLMRAMGIADVELVQARRGALLHDIGKMGVPDNILHKPGPLSDEEWTIMRRHPQHALDMLAPIHYLRPALDIPYCHHEKWDGNGYPRGLKGEQIPLAARVFAVVDVWDALTSDRPYRPAWSAAQARDHIAQGAGTHFDPRVVEAFLKMQAEDANGD